MNQSKQLTDGALLTAIFIVLLLIWFFIPITSIFISFALPVPFIIFTAKYDWKPSLIMFIATLIIGTLFATYISIPVVVISAVGGIMIGAAIKRKLTAYETWARGTVGFVVGLLFSLLFTQILLDVNIVDELNNSMETSIDMSQSMMSQLGLEEELIEEQFALVKETLAMIIDLLPMLIVMAAIVQAFISQWISYKVINRMDHKKLQFPKFHHLRFPVSIIWIYFLALVLSLFQSDPDSMLFIGLQNILVLAGFLMVIQGFSFLFFYTHYKRMSKAIPIIVIILTVIFLPLLLPLMRILGIIDIGFGLRDRLFKK
ncbi:Uncharacterized conserved protein YybS, DUF2232 family [Oceanobacillus limi]|uniref:Uncharacterized conserved protein YybS, DUF2232 family n=1 Tax=Oceanobacillus limi TaxID=930131 RepID=A0A1I0CZ44_9BACI|nr:YybS family protein [Oceanobacillus limi]SET24901.1 Uncharacterized conserved protein YybS, DUF2232 family [Oceanobacillus limi]